MNAAERWAGAMKLAPLVLAALALAACASEVPPEDTALARQWLAAVAAGDEAEALALAERLSPAPAIGTVAPEPTEAAFFRHNGLDPAFVAAAFNHWDFQHWSHALFFRRLARDLTAGREADPGAAVTALFRAVADRLTAADPNNPGALWPYDSWQSGRSRTIEWVFCELAYQWDARALIVYLRDPVTLAAFYSVVQIRSGDRVFTADPAGDVLLPDVSIARLRREPGLARAAWPARPTWAEGFASAALWAPVYPQDYCVRNQRLGRRVHELLGADAPRFGEEPVARVSFGPEAAEDLPCALWHYPVRVLGLEASEWSVATR